MPDETKKERAIILNVITGASPFQEESAGASISELKALCEACHMKTVAVVQQRCEKLNPATYAGKGKILEVKELAGNIEADCLVVDGQLSGAQMKNLADLTGLRILDRTLLILDIFAQRARTAEGRLQVELARLRDQLTRLSGSSAALSRLGGGIGTRGPGESQLEMDRRSIRSRSAELSKKLDALEKRRSLAARQRVRRKAQVFAICGYTNAGKSSLINLLCDSDLLARDQLFATLDPSFRRLPWPGPEVLLCDTVGFIRDLPHELVEAFKSTLDLVRTADYIIQVTDLSDPRADEQVEIVDRILKELGAGDKPRIHVLNKADKVGGSERQKRFYRGRSETEIPEIPVSIREGWNIQALTDAMKQLPLRHMQKQDIVLSYESLDLLNRLHRTSWIESQSFEEDGIHLRLYTPDYVSSLPEDGKR